MVAKNDKSVKSTAGNVPKRKKVSKACDSCRRRKIKCTGTQPCMNCQLHQCACIFSNNGTSSTTSSSINKKNQDKTKAVRLPRVKVPSDTVDQNNKTNVSNIESLLQQDNPSSKSTGMTGVTPTGSITSNISGNSNNSTCTFDREKPHTSSLYKVDLNSTSPCTPNEQFKLFNEQNKEFENGLYEGDIEDIPQYLECKETLEKLQAIPKRNKMIERMIDDTIEKINNLTQNWQPKVKLSKLPKLLKVLDPIDASKSLETQLMINKYRSRVHLSMYSHWSFNSRNEKVGLGGKTTAEDDDFENCRKESMSVTGKEGGYLNSVPLIDEIFGLYHPCEALSLRGIAYLTRKYSVLRPKCHKTKDQQIIRANIFLLLRFFDLCWLHMNEDRVSIANPLESYLQKNKGQSSLEFGSVVSPQNSIPSTTPTGNGGINSLNTPTLSNYKVSNSNNKEMVASILKTLPGGFLEYITPEISQKLLDNIDDDLKMFKLLLELCGNHKNKIEDFLRWISPPNKAHVDAHDLERCDRLVGVHELLLALCYSYYNTTMYYLQHINSLDYLELLLDMLDYANWAKEIYGFDRILNVAINYALKAGYSRWEYYVGSDEKTAERRRRVWWRLYIYDKSIMTTDSYLSGIDDSKMNCLLPKEFRDLGFLDHNDFIKRLHLISRNTQLDAMTVDQLVFYGKCATYQVISHFYSEVLYNEKYTSIRNTAKPSAIRTKLIGELFARMGLFTMRFDKIKEQVGRLFEIAENVNGPQFANISEADKHNAVSFSFEYTTLYCLVTRVSINIGIRVSIHPKPSYIKDRILSLSKNVYDKWTKMNQTLLQLDTSYDLWHVLEHYTFTFLLIITWMYDECAYIQHSDIVGVINVFEKLSQLKEVFIGSVGNSRQTLRFFSPLFSLFCVLTRILLTEYVGLDRMNSEAISKIFAKEGARTIELVKIIFDGNSYCYQLLLTPLEESVFHTSIKKMLKSDYDIKVEENPPSSGADTEESGANNGLEEQRSQQQPFSRSISEQIVSQPVNTAAAYNKSTNFPSTTSETGGLRKSITKMLSPSATAGIPPTYSPIPNINNPPNMTPSGGNFNGVGVPSPNAAQHRISHLLQAEIMNNPLISQTPPLPSLVNSNNTLLYPPTQNNGDNVNINGKRQDSSPQIGYIDKRFFQPLDFGILEDFFNSTDFTDLGSL